MRAILGEWCRPFFKAYIICYVSIVGLFILIDAFSNLDEFAKSADDLVEMAQVMGRYYLIQQVHYSTSLYGVIGLMAAIFTLSRSRLAGQGRDDRAYSR